MKFDGVFNNEISDRDTLVQNLKENAVPLEVIQYDVSNYADFLEKRRVEMTKLIKDYYYSL